MRTYQVRPPLSLTTSSEIGQDYHPSGKPGSPASGSKRSRTSDSSRNHRTGRPASSSAPRYRRHPSGTSRPASSSCLMYLHLPDNRLQLMNSPYCPFRSCSNGLRALPGATLLKLHRRLLLHLLRQFYGIVSLHGGSSLYPGQAINGPHGPFRSTITRPQLSQNSSSATSSAPGALRSGFAAKFSFVKSQLNLLRRHLLAVGRPTTQPHRSQLRASFFVFRTSLRIRKLIVGRRLHQ